MFKWPKINSKVKEGCVSGQMSEFPLGSIVFYYVAYNTIMYRGITHIGIVVDYKNGSPVIAHAANESATKNRPAIHCAVMSRLRAKNKKENLHYIVIKPDLPEHHLKLIVSLAQSLCTRDVSDSPIIKYSDERSAKSKKKAWEFYEKYQGSNLKNNFHTVLSKHVEYTRDLFSEKDEEKGMTGPGRGLYAPLAKMLNYMNTGLGDKLIKGFEKFKGISKSTKYHMAGNDLTHKGWHCVQFVVMVYQMAFLMIDNDLRGFYSFESLKNIKNTQYFSKKEGSCNNMKRLHPRNAIKPGSFLRSFISAFKSAVFAIPLESKLLSPAALLYYFVGRNFPDDFRGGHFHALVSDSGIYALGDLSLAADTLEQTIDDPQASRQVRLNRTQLKQNLLELRLIQWVTASQLMQRISVPRPIVVRRPKRGPDQGSSGSRKVARL